MAESERILFRLQHLVPQGLGHPVSAVTPPRKPAQPTINPSTSPGEPEEWTFPMTWGNVAAKVWGPPDGRPVFAIHGWLDNAATFDKLIPMLPKNLRIVAVDIPGHGLSDHFPPDIVYNFLDCLPAIERMARYFKWEKFSFLGHSLGGCMATLYAGIFPEKVEKMVLLDIVRVETTRPESMHIRLRKTINVLLNLEESVIAGPEKPCSYEKAVERSVIGTFGSLDEEACHVLFKRGLKKVEGGYIFTRDRRLRAAPLLFAPKEDQLMLAKKITGEVLIIKFSEGPYFESVENYEEQVEAMRVSSKKLQYIEVEGQHHTHLTHPERVALHITNFFNS